MAKLKTSEFRLLLLFAIVAFVLVNVYGYRMLASRHGEILKQRDQLEGRLKTAAVYELAETESLRKEAWLNSRVPVYGSEDHMKTFLLKFVEQRASSYELVPELQPREPEVRDGYMCSVLEVKVSGTIEQLGDLIFSLLDPEEFRSITSIDLKSKPKDPKTLFAEFTIEQWWNVDSPALVANAEAQPTEIPATAVAPEVGPAPAGGVQPPAPGDAAVPTPTPTPTPLSGVPGLPGIPDAEATARRVLLPDQTQNPATPAPTPAADGPDAQIPVPNETAEEEDNPQ